MKKKSEAFDLLGNTVVVPVVKFVADSLLDSLKKIPNHFYSYNSISSEIPV